MVQLTDEFGAKIWLAIGGIKYFKENVGGMYAQQHKKALSVIENVYGDIFYLLESVEEICDKLFDKKKEVK